MAARRLGARAGEWTLLAGVLGVAAILRLHGLFTARLAQVDEISSLNQLDLPWFAGAQANTNYLVTMVLGKALRGIVDFPALRLFPALGGVAAIAFVYFALRPLVAAGVALGAAGLLAVSWNLVYFSQLFEVGSFDPIVACLLLAAVAQWIRDRGRTGWLVAGGALLGIQFNSHVVPTGYTILLYGAWVALACAGGVLRWRVLAAVIAATSVGMLPYLATSLGNPALQSAFENSYAAVGQSGGMVWAVNLRQPAAALRTLVEYCTAYPLPPRAPLQSGLVLGLIALVAVAVVRTPARALKTYLAWMSFGTLLLIAILPAALYAESHLHSFWPHFVALLCLMIASTRGALRIALAAGALALAAWNLSWLGHWGDRQVAAVTAVLDSELPAARQVFISDGARLKLQWTPAWPRLQAKGFQEFLCGDPAARPKLAGGESALVLLTYECGWPPPDEEARFTCELLLDLNQLYEAHEAHGLRAYRMTPIRRGDERGARPEPAPAPGPTPG